MGVIIRPLAGVDNTILAFNSVLLAIFAVVVLRFPWHGLIWVLGPLLCTSAALNETTAARRAEAIAVNLLTFATLQFLYAVVEPWHWLRIVLISSAVWVTSYRKCGNNSGAVVVASLMNFEKGTFQNGLDTLLLMVLLAGVIPLTYLGLERLLFGRKEMKLFNAANPLGADAVVRRMAAFALAQTVENTLTWQFSYWTTLTVGLIYSGGVVKRNARGIALIRMLGAPGAFCLSVLWLSTIGYINYQFNYLAVVWAIFAFYYSFSHNDYVGFFLLFNVMLSGASNLEYGASPLYGNAWNLIFQSSAAVFLGALIVLLTEFDPDETPDVKTA